MSEPKPTLDQLLQSATRHQQAGRLPQAETIYREVLRQNPRHVDALHLLATLAHQVRRHDIAVDLIRRALAVQPNSSPGYRNLGIILNDMGRFDEAIDAFRRAITLEPRDPEAHNNLGFALSGKKQVDDAMAAYRRAIALRPDYREAWNNLGRALTARGQLDDAIAAHRQAILLGPGHATAHNNLGVALQMRGRLDEAIAAYRQAVALNPQFSDAYGNLAIALTAEGRLEEAIAAYRQAITLKPDDAAVYSNLGNTLKDQGRFDDAIASFRRAIALDPGYYTAHSNLIYASQFSPGYGPRAIADELDGWDRRHAQPLAIFIQPHLNDRDPERRLRIGYVSPDFRDHTVGLSLLPLIREHDRERYHITGYANVAGPDAMTEQFRHLADGWRDINTSTDESVAAMVRADAIDILVDTTLHMSGNRLLLFARKPAPVQVTFSGYPGSTGLTTIDYRLTDPWLDPPDATGARDTLYVERSCRLADTFWCYEAPVNDMEVGPLPALSLSNGTANGTFTFGCLNNFCKVNEHVLALWARVMRQVTGSRLVLLAPPGSARDQVRETLARDGIDPSRIDFVGSQPRRQYLATYHRIDICLDTFPYNGHWTSLDALWMGVPVVSLIGETVAGRGGLSILSNLGLAELTAPSQEQYVRVASDLAGDLPRLGTLRSSLRRRMEQSPLMDAPRFARNIESAYRQMWRRWCAQGTTSH